MVIGPQGLDEVLGCGGVMALHADAGDRVEVLSPGLHEFRDRRPAWNVDRGD